MLDHQPVLRERLIAASTFALIMLGGAVSLDFLLTSGMQWGSDPKSSPSLQPSIQTAAPADNFVAFNDRAARAPGAYRERSGQLFATARARTDAEPASTSLESLRGEIEFPYAAVAPDIEEDELEASPKEQTEAPDGADDEFKDPEWSYDPSSW